MPKGATGASSYLNARQIVLGTVLLLDPASIIYIRRFLVLLSYFYTFIFTVISFIYTFYQFNHL